MDEVQQIEHEYAVARRLERESYAKYLRLRHETVVLRRQLEICVDDSFGAQYIGKAPGFTLLAERDSWFD